MEDDKQLGDAADLFGLDEFGAGGMLTMFSGALGAGLATGAAVVARQVAKPNADGTPSFLQKHSELVGLLAGAAVGAGMAAMPSTRSAGWGVLAGAVATNGLRLLETMMNPDVHVLGGVVINPTHAWAGGLGMVDIQPTTAWLGAGDGSGMPQLLGGRGGLGAGNPGRMPQLVGASLGAASQHVQLLGGPALSDVAGNWGSTHFNKR